MRPPSLCCLLGTREWVHGQWNRACVQASLAVRGFNKLSVAIADTNLQLKVTPASCFFGFAHAGKMDAHRLSTGQALTKDLAIKDTSLTKSLQDKLQTC